MSDVPTSELAPTAEKLLTAEKLVALLTAEQRAAVETAQRMTTLTLLMVVGNIKAKALEQTAVVEVERDAAKMTNTTVLAMAERASRKGYDLDPLDVLAVFDREATP